MFSLYHSVLFFVFELVFVCRQIPGLYFDPSSTKLYCLYLGTDGIDNHMIATVGLPLNTWTTVTVSIFGNQMTMAAVNSATGVAVFPLMSMIIPISRSTVSDVILYATIPDYSAATAQIRKLIIYTVR